MAAYANVHHALELMRVRALAAVHGSPVPGPPGGAPVRADPPRVLVVGPDNSGKTSLVKVLANYCVRAGQGWTPLLVNVDPVEGACAAPGTVSAAPLTAPLGTASSAGALGSAATARPVHLQSNALLPLVYWYGHSTVARNPLLLDRLIRTLGENIADRWDYDAEGRAAGMIVDTPGAFATARPGNKGPDYRLNLLKACVEAFRSWSNRAAASIRYD
jgi:polyribonucleotide 5'-hydroxyl-kinase